MAKPALLDANVVLRYLLADDPAQSPEAVDLIEQAPADSLHLSILVLAEVTWTLRSHFAVPRREISSAIQRIVARPSISVDPIALDAVARYARTTLDFVDCALAAASAAAAVPLVTFDRDYRKFPDIAAQRPRAWLADLAKNGES